ncbi:MAG TPA: TIR domain-containing protein [Phototrophicaceae bacterium]|nr:TIR domain-containing protein [Phototrophicaceae bacterium]
MSQHPAEYADDDPFEVEDIEAYCVRCRETITVDNPMPVWTRKGMPATRGDCPQCGGTVFRMGATDAHTRSDRPTPVAVGDSDRRRPPQLTRDTVYINYAPTEIEFAQSLAADLNNAGIAAWLQESDASDVAWAGGVHPALKECNRMVYVLSPASLSDEQVAAGMQFFRSKRKPVVIAQVSPTTPPDDIRRSPRFDFATDYKSAFRQMLQALSS